MDSINELFSVYFTDKCFNLNESYFVGTFTSEAFAVEGFQQWIKDFLIPFYSENIYLIKLVESIQHCSSIKSINLTYSKFGGDDTHPLYVIRHRPNEIMKDTKV